MIKIPKAVLNSLYVKGNVREVLIKKDCYKEEIKMQMDVWSVIAIIIVVVGFFGGIWYEHR